MACEGLFYPVCEAIEQLLSSREAIAGMVSLFENQIDVEAVKLRISENREVIATLAAVAYPVWKGWRYRDAVLHTRLDEYLRKQHDELDDGVTFAMNSLSRPVPHANPSTPRFSTNPLRKEMRRRNWRPTLTFRGYDGFADAHTERAIESIERKIRVSEKNVELLRKQLASAHLIKGTINSAQAAERAQPQVKQTLNERALASFESVLEVEGFEDSKVAAENIARQHTLLGSLDLAEDHYNDLLSKTLRSKNKRSRAFATARILKHLAAMAQASTDFGSGTARKLLTAVDKRDKERGALEWLKPHVSSMKDWELIEYADTHLLTAYVSRKLQSNRKERLHLNAAAKAYKRAFNAHRGLWLPEASRRIKLIANVGRNACSRARRTGQYPVGRLVPKASHHSDYPPATVSDSGGQKPIPDAPQQS